MGSSLYQNLRGDFYISDDEKDLTFADFIKISKIANTIPRDWIPENLIQKFVNNKDLFSVEDRQIYEKYLAKYSQSRRSCAWNLVENYIVDV